VSTHPPAIHAALHGVGHGLALQQELSKLGAGAAALLALQQKQEEQAAAIAGRSKIRHASGVHRACQMLTLCMLLLQVYTQSQAK